MYIQNEKKLVWILAIIALVDEMDKDYKTPNDGGVCFDSWGCPMHSMSWSNRAAVTIRMVTRRRRFSDLTVIFYICDWETSGIGPIRKEMLVHIPSMANFVCYYAMPYKVKIKMLHI